MNMIDLKYEWHKAKERTQLRIAFLLPRWLVRWAVVRAAAHATTGEYSGCVTSEVTVFEVMDRWEKAE